MCNLEGAALSGKFSGSSSVDKSLALGAPTPTSKSEDLCILDVPQTLEVCEYWPKG